MDELKKLFEAIAQEKTRNLKLEEEKVLKQVEKTQKRQAHKEQVKEDFWGVFTSELKKLSEQEEEAQDKLGRLKEIKEQFVEATPHLYQEPVEEEIQESAQDFFKDIDPQKMASEFDIRPVSQMTDDMSTTSQPYELIDHPTEVKSVPQSHVEKTFVIPEEDKTGKLDPDIAALEAKVNKLELKYAGVIEDEPTPELTPEPVIESKDSYSTVMDVLSLKPVEKKDKVERQLQELAVQYLSDKKQSVQEQVDETASVQKQINEINTNIRQLILGMQGIGGGGEVRLEFLDDIDRSTAKVNNKFLMYDSTIEKWKGVDAHEESGLDRVTSHVIPSADDTYDLGSSTLRWRDIYTSGSTIDIGGMKLQNDGSHNLEIKDGSGNKQAISANIAFSDITGKPTTVSGYGISDALSLTSLSVGSEASASGDGGISYNNSTGVFTYTPPDLSAKADLASPALTGNPTAPTQSASDNSTKIATTAYTDTAVANIVDSAPGTLNTLNELAAALGDDANFSTTVTNNIATKAPLASAALTGTPTAPTASTGTNTTQIATTAFVKQEIDALKALLYAYDQS
ncbi:MAG: hypothetical protein CL515_04000 [Actinobacteria bacterium]|nr:hypothetical protein [Actinomycetota bacterium]|tara:strand:- start:55848 stop:57557 length:1710 start_codon:yes stop_codon:yes gene_type:complete